MGVSLATFIIDRSYVDGAFHSLSTPAITALSAHSNFACALAHDPAYVSPKISTKTAETRHENIAQLTAEPSPFRYQLSPVRTLRAQVCTKIAASFRPIEKADWATPPAHSANGRPAPAARQRRIDTLKRDSREVTSATRVIDLRCQSHVFGVGGRMRVDGNERFSNPSQFRIEKQQQSIDKLFGL